MTVRDVTDLSAAEAHAEAEWQAIRQQRARAARALRTRRIVPTREAIDQYLRVPHPALDARSEESW